MAKRVHEAREDEARATKQKDDFIAAPGYHGQVVVEDNDIQAIIVDITTIIVDNW